MIGTSWIREQGLKDPLLLEVLRKHDMADVPLWKRSFPERDALMERWVRLAEQRDGPVNSAARRDDTDAAEVTERVKQRAYELGADLVGVARLRPEFIRYGAELSHDFVVAFACSEDYSKSVEGPDAVDLEAMHVYARCAEIATDLASFIRQELGYSAIAHHNGAFEIQAIPVMYEAGFGELGKHGSLINPELGANFRPGFVSTTLPLLIDSPLTVGVQDYCIHCDLCTNNCPGDAIAVDYILTEGIKRWLIDTEKCYPISRLREEYCHICVDVCPYIHKENRDARKKDIFRQYMKQRKVEGYKSPKRNS